MVFKNSTNTIHYGTHIENDELPVMHKIETLLFLHNEGGINNAFKNWGDVMKSRYSSTVSKHPIDDDISIVSHTIYIYIYLYTLL
mgnify:CR=1 FL=1